PDFRRSPGEGVGAGAVCHRLDVVEINDDPGVHQAPPPLMDHQIVGVHVDLGSWQPRPVAHLSDEATADRSTAPAVVVDAGDARFVLGVAALWEFSDDFPQDLAGLGAAQGSHASPFGSSWG